jgi:hypothetical protein
MQENVNLILIISIKGMNWYFKRKWGRSEGLKISENCPFKWGAPFLPDNDAGLDV